ncbi:hypothetical protein [Mycobacterium sp. 1274756.6]|uniref:hypothetical protein n=1 Tax=Mycobacterium sp. 1274756.6 TaxID=1834076 RepID=UPI0007FE64F3|nr:hypothetical protein [Mycobacterium sp. 1274756.6]OBJ67508.1 hypothetical protein A5643_17345 [Mycobacterium sp. 1274756.6]
MTRLTQAIGAILVVTGVVAYIATSAASVTALIPAFVGAALLAAGLIARKPAAHRHAIHAALVVALIGALGSLMQVAKIGALFDGTAERPAAIIVSTVMFVLLVGYLVAGVRSFIAARQAQPESDPAA